MDPVLSGSGSNARWFSAGMVALNIMLAPTLGGFIGYVGKELRLINIDSPTITYYGP